MSLWVFGFFPGIIDRAASRTRGGSVTHGAQRESFDASWKFARFGDMPDGTKLAETTASAPGFDDSKWRTVNLPHDWGIEGPFRADLPNSTGKLPWVGIGWYRKTGRPANRKGDDRGAIRTAGPAPGRP